MKAATLHRFGEPLRLDERPEPETEPGGIVLRVLGAGVCHTDLHIIDGAIPDVPSNTLPRQRERIGDAFADHNGVCLKAQT